MRTSMWARFLTSESRSLLSITDLPSRQRDTYYSFTMQPLLAHLFQISLTTRPSKVNAHEISCSRRLPVWMSSQLSELGRAAQVCYKDIKACHPLTLQKTSSDSNESFQQRFERVRERQLRQRYRETYSKNLQTKIAAQVRLDTQYRLRARRSQIAIEPASDAAIESGLANGQSSA